MLPNMFEYPFLIRIFDKLLSDQDKINIISVSKNLNQQKTKFKFYKKYICKEEDCNKWYFQRLTKIIVFKIFKFPECVTHLKLDMLFDDFIENIPKSITHLSFGDGYGWYTKSVPNWITHLKLNNTVRLTPQIIPNSVTHLKFNHLFNKRIENCIPNSVIRLEFGYCFNHSIEYLPDSIKYLSLECNYDKFVTKLPSNLRKLECCKSFLENNKHLNFDGILIIDNSY